MRNLDYHSEIALREDTVRKSPDKARAYNNFGYAYQLDVRTRNAVWAYRCALRLDPGYRKAAGNLASILAAGGHDDPTSPE